MKQGMRKLITRRIIYKTTNNINGKIYIGKSEKNDPNYLGSGKIIRQAIKRYGKENFTRKDIDIAFSKQELNEKEIYWVDFYDARNPEIGYNIAPGGKGVGSGKDHHMYGKTHSKEARAKISLANKGKILTQEQLDKMVEGAKKSWLIPEYKEMMSNIRKEMWKDPEFKRKRSEYSKKVWEDPEYKAKKVKIMKEIGATPEFKAKMAAISTGKTHTEESKRKISEARKGMKFSDEHRANISKAQEGRIKGSLSLETRKRMSESSKGKPKSEEHCKNLAKANIGKKATPEKLMKMVEIAKNQWSDPKFRDKVKEGWERRKRIKEELDGGQK